jgi:hypothetical protein
MNVIPEMRRAHLIWYLRFYYYQYVNTSAGWLLVPEGIMLRHWHGLLDIYISEIYSS